MHELLKIILGDYTTIQLLGYLWFFIVGYIIFGLTEATGRDIKNPSTPYKWSWKFWFQDNCKRYLTTLLCTYVLFRFYVEVYEHPFGNFDAVSLGLIGDGIASTIKKRVAIIGSDREKIMTNIDDKMKVGYVEQRHEETNSNVNIGVKNEQNNNDIKINVNVNDGDKG